MKNKTLYAITSEDVVQVAEEEDISFKAKDLDFIQEKIGDFFGGQWRDAVEYALNELKQRK